uniref:G_PROTEIN_RECEP_F1_2 domain-containing protein n=1 Tax=Panagrellus redivivus TaxID=6233 RepID=A0A7E4W2D8_PANRE
MYPQLENSVNYRLTFVDNPTLQLVNFWLFGSICKIIPSLILCIMSVLLVGSLRDIQQMQARFASVERDRQHYRTTKIILVIMSIFIIVEFPQGVFAVAHTITVLPYKDFLGDFFEMLTLFASCLIFALFCSMNSRLRSAFFDLATKFVDRPFGLLFRRGSEPMKINSSKTDILITESTSAHESHSLVEWTGNKDSKCPADAV